MFKIQNSKTLTGFSVANMTKPSNFVHSQIAMDGTMYVPGISKPGRGSNQNYPMEYPAMALPARGLVSTLFRGAFQQGFLSIFYAIGNRPLELWEKQLRNGSLKRILDYEIRSQTVELLSTNIASAFITSPPGPYQSLGIRLPIIVLVVKNLKRYFLFEIQILDDTRTRRRFKVANYHTSVKVRPLVCLVPMSLDEGWNQIELNLAEMTRKSFGTGFVEAVRVQIHANCRLRRVYFCEKVFSEDDVPSDFKSFVVNTAKGTAAGELPTIRRPPKNRIYL